MLGVCCCPGLSPAAGSGGYSLAVWLRLLIVVASFVAECRLSGVQASVAAAHELSSFGSQAPEHRLNSRGAPA